MKTKGWIIGILGLWIALSAFIGFGVAGHLWNFLIAGIIISITGLTLVRQKPWQGILAFIAGTWLIVAAFAGSLHIGSILIWNHLVAGLLIALAGFTVLGQEKPTELHSH